MREFNVRYSHQAQAQLAELRHHQRSARKRRKHDDARLLLEAELTHDADRKGWPHSPFRSFQVIDEYPLRFVFWSDYPDVWIVEVWPVPRDWWRSS